MACGFDFEVFYGQVGHGFIQVHHLVPLHSIRKTYKLHPIKDLRPVCANCHAIIHKHKPELSIEELSNMINACKI
ncbi:HNH endonuclease [Paenibacillus sp. N3.4]|uniref:HNH endonuclease n=1 Tax=Paenibacillus sp. N3.4 TaxID=2603222 RepID=UPI0011C90E7C|nr:hypothetical protein FU659_19420 [Paenibacillus sp. N3.4]